jgi:hypothetical protein
MRTAVILLTSTMAIGAACSGSPAGPSGPPGGQQPPPSGAVLQIHTRVANLRVGEREDVSVNLSGGGGDLTGLATLESSDITVFVVEAHRRIRGVGPGSAQLRGSYQGLTSQVPQVVVEIGPTPNGGPSTATAAMVINEFRTSGPAGPNDEFIELRNLGSATVDLTGWSIAINTATNHRESFGRILGPAVVAPGCHYLLTGAGGPNAYSSGGITLGDFRWASTFFQDDTSFALLDPAGNLIDQVGLNASPLYVEGSPLAALVGRSRERSGDSNNNAADFRSSAQDNPRNTTSSCQ